MCLHPVIGHLFKVNFLFNFLSVASLTQPFFIFCSLEKLPKIQSCWLVPFISGWCVYGLLCKSLRRLLHDDVIKWKHFPRYWPFVRGIHRWPVNLPHKGQWREALMSSLICPWINGWIDNREAGDLRRNRAHYDVIVMPDCVDWAGTTFRELIWKVGALFIKKHHRLVFEQHQSHSLLFLPPGGLCISESKLGCRTPNLASSGMIIIISQLVVCLITRSCLVSGR